MEETPDLLVHGKMLMHGRVADGKHDLVRYRVATFHTEAPEPREGGGAMFALEFEADNAYDSFQMVVAIHARSTESPFDGHLALRDQFKCGVDTAFLEGVIAEVSGFASGSGSSYYGWASEVVDGPTQGSRAPSGSGMRYTNDMLVLRTSHGLPQHQHYEASLWTESSKASPALEHNGVTISALERVEGLITAPMVPAVGPDGQADLTRAVWRGTGLPYFHISMSWEGGVGSSDAHRFEMPAFQAHFLGRLVGKQGLYELIIGKYDPELLGYPFHTTVGLLPGRYFLEIVLDNYYMGFSDAGEFTPDPIDACPLQKMPEFLARDASMVCVCECSCVDVWTC
jgi:hypothetical protein